MATARADAAKTARIAAVGVDSLLTRSKAARAGVQPALDHIAACTADESDIQALRDAADTRTALRSNLVALDLTPLGPGARLKAALAHLLLLSVNADEEYARWGELTTGCVDTAAQDSAKRRGDGYSVQATAAKRSFIRLWNPVAATYGLPPRDPNTI